jgi:hypothetical protein
MSASDAQGSAAAAPAAKVPFEDWASVQRRRARRDGAWQISCEERYVNGVVSRSVYTWHHAGQDREMPSKVALCGSRASRKSRAISRRSRASASGVPLGTSVQKGRPPEGLPKPRPQNARKRRSAQRSADYHATREAEASAATAASTASVNASLCGSRQCCRTTISFQAHAWR